jgi:hypothetical protein
LQSGGFEIASVVLTEMNVNRNVEFKNLLSFKSEFSFGKSHKSQEPSLDCRGVYRKAYTRAVAWAGALS